MCYIWFKTGVQIETRVSIHNWSKYLIYPKELSTLCLTEETLINRLNPQQFLFMIFIASRYRQLPGTSQNKKIGTKNYDKTQEIPVKIAQKCLDIAPDLDHVEISVLASSFYMSNINLRGGSLSKDLQKIFFDALLTAPVDIVGTYLSPINDLCKIQMPAEHGLYQRGNGVFLNKLVARFVF